MDLLEVKIPSESNLQIKHSKILKGPYQMSFDITNKCNFRCLHCFNRSGENFIIKNELTDDEVLDFAKDISQLKLFNFCFCGGEPLLRFELMCEVSEILSKEGTTVSFVSNGYLLNKEKAKILLDNGVTRAQISLDGSNEVSHEKLRRMKGSFKKAVEALKVLKEVGYKDISVAFCPTKWNINELEETFDLCKNLGVKTFRVQPLMILGRAKENVEEILPTPLQYRELVKKIEILKRTYINENIIEWGDPVDHLIRFPNLIEYCSTFASIRADGSIEVSPYLPIIVGNIRKHKFSEYWNKGLPKIWSLPIVKNIANKILSIYDMGKDFSNLPKVWFEKDIEIDIIDDNIFGG